MAANLSSKPETISGKKEAVKLLIERYYRQLTDGCGRQDCDNELCASSPRFSLRELDRNKVAAKALELAKNKSNLCDEMASRTAADPTAMETVSAAAGSSSSLIGSAAKEAWVEDQRGRPGHTSQDSAGMTSVGSDISQALKPSSSAISSKALLKKENLTKINSITEEDMMSIIDSCEKSAAEGFSAPWSRLIHTIGQVFSDPEALMSSFLRTGNQHKEQLKEKSNAWAVAEGMVAGSSTAIQSNTMEASSSAPVQCKEDLRSMEIDEDKDLDSESGNENADEVEVDNNDGINMEVTSEVEEEDNNDGINMETNSGSDVDCNGSAERSDRAEKRISRKRSSSRSGVNFCDDSDAVRTALAASNNDIVPHDSIELSVDLEVVRRIYARLFTLPDLPFQSAMLNAITYLSRTLEIDRRVQDIHRKNENYINIFLIIMEIPYLDSLEFIENATPNFCKALSLVPVDIQAKLVRVWSKFSADELRAMIQRLQQLITVRVVTNQWTHNNLVHDDDGLTCATKVLKMFYYASLIGGEMDSTEVLQREKLAKEEASGSLSHILQGAIGYELKERLPEYCDPLAVALGNIQASDCRRPLVPASEFVNESLSEALEMDKDYANYRATLAAMSTGLESSAGLPSSSLSAHFSFMLHPFMLSTSVKSTGLFYDNRIRMMSERRESLFRSMMHGNITMPYLRLRIRRDHIIDDSLVNLEVIAMDNPQDLKKQLYVEFEGEQGIDEGGVSKEFFQLIVEEIFNPDIGMFTYMKESGTFWFNSTSFENDGQFMLIGIVLGLAIYNNVILDIHFPMVVYRKLMGKLGTFSDLVSSHPIVAQSLKEFLKYEGDVSETFMQPFAVGTDDVFGGSHVHLLKENGDDIIVTNETRQEFVDLYADFLLNKSVDKQFRAFQRGFQMVTDESPLSMLFYPEEIEQLVCGSQAYDFQALEKATDYDSGYTADTPIIKNFWDVVLNELTDEQKRQFLQFTTGSDRAPIGGLSKLKLVIARNGPDSDRLPTSHTCFNVLLLPEYETKEKLKERLLKAITYSKGFGML